MAKAILLCGKICAGKSAYARRLASEIGAAILSTDEIMLSLFGPDAGEMHDVYAARLEEYELEKAAQLVNDGINTILDRGFWTREARLSARRFFGARGVESELHYIDVSDEEWARRVKKRNEDVLRGETQAYYADEGLMRKCLERFEPPRGGEADVTIKQ